MKKLNDYVQGKCMEMCPKEEMRMRETQKLLHVLEMVPGTENSSTPKVDVCRAVKAFSRSAAGKSVNKAEDLRPPEILLQTVNYLLFDVIDVKYLPFHVIYDFLTDRLRAVRQDMVIQNISVAESISILQPIVRFHAYAAYRLCTEDITKFDLTLNRTHLQECLKKLLYFYDCYDQLLNNYVDPQLTHPNAYLAETRPALEALYVILNLGNAEAQRRVLGLTEKCSTEVVQKAFALSLACSYGNFVKSCRLMAQLPPLLAATACLHLPQIRRRAFEVMCLAYNNRTLSFPLDDLKETLLYDSEDHLSQDCDYYGLHIDSISSCVHFTKTSFNKKNPVPPRHEAFVERKLAEQSLQSLVLFGS